MFNKASMTESESNIYKIKKEMVAIKTRLNFLLEHNGLRKGFLHMILGSTGGGKTTLVRSILKDILHNNGDDQKVLLWLSEESADDYKSEMSFGITKGLDNVTIFSEMDSLRKPDEYMFILSEYIKSETPDVVLIDNVTTSSFYASLRPNDQGEVVLAIKRLAKENNCAVILVAHTRAEANDNCGRLIHENDVRGGKSISNIVEFLYIMQRFEIGSTMFPTLRLRKARGQDVEKSLFTLGFKKTSKLYEYDISLSFDEFKEKFKMRNTL